MQFKMDLAHETTTKNLPIVIIGGGPVGGFLAHKFRQEGKKIILVEERTGYVRPGTIAPRTCTLLFKDELGIDAPFLSDETYYCPRIKDIERALHEETLKYPEDITVIQSTFKKLIPGGIALADQEIKCDCVIDCTGSRRAVLKATNDIEIHDEKLAFKEIESVESIEKSLIVRCGEINELSKFAKLIKTNYHGRIEDDLEDNNAIAILKLEALRAKYGWDKTTIPYRTVHQLRKERNKVVIYMEKPQNLPDERIDEWVLDVLKIHAGEVLEFTKKENTSRKYGNKPRNQSFFIEPKKSNIMYCRLPGYPVIVPVGDSQVDPDFRTGTGLVNSVKRASYFVSCLKECGFNVKTFNYKSYDEGVQSHIQTQENRENEFYQKRRELTSPQVDNNLRNAYFYFKKGFNPDLSELTEPVYTSLKKIFLSVHMDSIWDQYGQEATVLLKNIASDFSENFVMTKFLSCLHELNNQRKFPDFEQTKNIYLGFVQEVRDENYIEKDQGTKLKM